MAANYGNSSAERNKGWYQDDLVEVNAPIRKLLENYSKVPSGEVVKHVNEIRKRAFASNPYPCIGLYFFLNLTLLSHPLYHTILERLQAPDAIYLDLGCCFGQDLRQLAMDGIPSQRLIGLDIEEPLMEQGYDFFLDRGSLQSRFLVADIFKGSAQGSVWTDLEERGVDVVHCSAFFHLFTKEEQTLAAKNIGRLVKKGGLILGRTMGSIQGTDFPGPKEGTVCYRHNIETFDEMWRQVGEITGTSWEVEGSLDMVGVRPETPIHDENSRRLLFAVRRID